MTMKKAVQLRMKKLPKEQVSNVDYFEARHRCFLIISKNEGGRKVFFMYLPLMCFYVF